MHYLSRLLQARIAYDKAGDDGASGGGESTSTLAPPVPPDRSSTGGKPQAIPMNEGADEPASAQPSDEPAKNDKGGNDDMNSIRESIRETASKIPQNDRSDEIIPYHDEVDEDEDAGADEPTGQEPKKETSGDEPDTSTDAPDEGATEKYYDPEIHAEGKDVFPNAYNSRQDAEYAIAAKLDLYDSHANELSEMDSDVGATVPANIQEQIDQFRDVTNLSEADDDQVRDFISNLDMAIKSVDEKKQNVSQRYQQKQQTEKVDQKFTQAQKDASEAMKNIGMDKKVNELPEGATVDDVLSMADSLIEEQLAPIDQQIEEMENNTKFAQQNGQQAWLNKIRELENKRSDLESTLRQDRQKLVEFNDARIEKQQLESKKPVKLTDKERYQKMDDVYGDWADDRSQGKFKLDMFDAPTTEPIAHFRKFALSPSNQNKFDLTTKAGWDKMHDHWKQTMSERFQQSQQKQIVDQKKKKQSSAEQPIPEPPINDGQGQPASSTHNEMQKARERVKRNSRRYFSG